MDAETYFQERKQYFWLFEEGGDVLSIPHGGTIAYRAYIVQVLEALQDQGFPNFGSLLLLVIATNSNAAQDLDAVYALMKKYSASGSVGELLDDSLRFLKLLAGLPPEYKEQTARLLVLKTILKDCHNRHATSRSGSLIAYLKSGKAGLPPVEFSLAAFHNDFRVIALLGRRYLTVNAIVKDLGGVVTIEEELLPETIAPQENTTDLVQQLIEEKKTFTTGSLVKWLWSGINIPFHSHGSGQQPIGGVSDIANRGSLDRLLITEFANDDLLLALRLANNEALYINRELPPQKNNRERVVLIDASLLNWGTPKTIAFSILVALARHPRSNYLTKAFVLGKSCTPIAYHTVDDVIHSLGVVEGVLDAAEGLDLFFKENKSSADREVIFISTEEAVKQPAMGKVLQDRQQQINYRILASAEGAVTVYQRQNKSTKLLQQLQLPLAALWQHPPKERLSSKTAQGGNASYTDSNEVPILYPTDPGFKDVVQGIDGSLVMVSRKRHLFFKPTLDNTQGWQLVKEKITYSHGELELGYYADGSPVLLIYDQQDKQLILQPLNNAGNIIRLKFKWVGKEGLKNMFFKDGLFYILQGMPGFPSCKTVEPHGGKIEDIDRSTITELTPLFEERRHERSLLRAKITVQNTLVNVKHVSINTSGNLVLNNHELRLENNTFIRFRLNEFPQTHFASGRSDNQFKFDDGSRLTIDLAGMMWLQMAMPEKYSVVIIEVMGDPDKIIQSLEQAHYNLGAEAKDCIRLKKSVAIATRLTKADAAARAEIINNNALRDMLLVEWQPMLLPPIYIPCDLEKDLGVFSQGQFAGNDYYRLHNPDKISAAAFWETYIERFVNNIRNYGDATKTQR